MKKNSLKSLIISLIAILMAPAIASALTRPAEFHDRYRLKEMVVLSRHSIRAPLSTDGSALSTLTPHKWIEWSAAPSELTLRGGALETIMGQYFRKYLVNEGMFPENHRPDADEVNIYANSMQRTVATAQYFTSGFMPLANLTVNHRFSPSKMDPVFFPRLTKSTSEFRTKALKEIAAMGGKKGMKGISENLKENYKLLAGVLDTKDSPAALQGKKVFEDFDTQIILKSGDEPRMTGALKDANSASDALILQYYEAPDTVRAAFGHELSRADWERIARIKDVYGDVLFTAPSVAANVANPLLHYIFDELNSEARKFTYLVGHDSNIASVTAALGVESYELPQAIEKRTPIGSKLVIEKWLDADGEEFVSLSLVYQTPEQLRNISLLDLQNPPAVYRLKLTGLTANSDGLYKLADLNARFREAFAAYEEF